MSSGNSVWVLVVVACLSLADNEAFTTDSEESFGKSERRDEGVGVMKGRVMSTWFELIFDDVGGKEDNSNDISSWLPSRGEVDIMCTAGHRERERSTTEPRINKVDFTLPSATL